MEIWADIVQWVESWSFYFMGFGLVSYFLGFMAGYNVAARKANKVIFLATSFLEAGERRSFVRALKKAREVVGESSASEKGGEGQ